MLNESAHHQTKLPPIPIQALKYSSLQSGALNLPVAKDDYDALQEMAGLDFTGVDMVEVAKTIK